jgi:2-phospho-L-lactate guanylyltransferase
VTWTRWTVVVPVKAPSGAKTRLALTPEARAAYAAAFATDTVAAALAAAAVAEVVVVTDDEALGRTLGDLGARVVTRSLPINTAVVEAARLADGPVAALPADLPALTPVTLAAALSQAQTHPRAVVADRAGTGTVLLAALRAADLDPRFGPGSCAAHVSAGSVELVRDAWPGLRCDVDTVADLDEAVRLGVGPATRAVLGG